MKEISRNFRCIIPQEETLSDSQSIQCFPKIHDSQNHDGVLLGIGSVDLLRAGEILFDTGCDYVRSVVAMLRRIDPRIQSSLDGRLKVCESNALVVVNSRFESAVRKLTKVGCISETWLVRRAKRLRRVAVRG